MAFINPDDHAGSVGHLAPDSIQNSTTTAQNIVISPAGLTEVPLPGGGFVTNAVMSQEGGNLILETPDGITLVIEGYFSGATPPDLVSPDGKVLTPALVKSFIQASTDYAEDTVAHNDVTPVGQVQEVSGMATVTHQDGTKETIVKGTAIFEGDVVETDAQGAVNIGFVDESSFAVSNNAKMAIDEFVFDAKSHDGENNFSMLRGLFVYTSGLVGREDPDDVKIQTPVGSIGIRGTIITGSLPAEGSAELAKISVVEGAIVIHANNGSDMTLSKQFETVQIDANGTVSNVGVLPQGEMAETFNVLRTVAPTLFSAIEEAQGEEAPATTDAPPADAAPVTEEAAPQEEAPAQDTAPAEPAPLPDVIQLNLLPGALDPVTMDKPLTAAEAKTLISSAPLVELAGLGLAPAPVVTTTASANTTYTDTATTPPTEILGDPGNSGTGNPPPVNVAPVAALTAHTFLEQAALQGQTYTLDVGRFFSDANGDFLTYTVTPGNLGGTIANMTVGAGGLLTFTVNNTVPGGTTNIDFSIVASDGTLQSAPIQFFLGVVGEATNGITVSNGNDTLVYVSTAGTVVSTLAGDDNVTILANNVTVFGDVGNDSITLTSGQNNARIYGDDGNDSINVLNSTGNLLSGGTGNDMIVIGNSNAAYTFQAFGGADNDTIILNSQAGLTSLSTGSSLIDGGEGLDTVGIGTGATLDLNTISVASFMSIERLKGSTSGASHIELDIMDIFGHSGNRTSMYIYTDGDDTVTVTNNDGLAALTWQAGTVTDGEGHNYNTYSNGTFTLYISTETTGNVNGGGIVV